MCGGGTHCGCLQQREGMGVTVYKSTNEIFGTKVRKYMTHIGSLLPILVDCGYFFSSPEHKVLMLSYCDQSLSVVCALSTFCFK